MGKCIQVVPELVSSYGDRGSVCFQQPQIVEDRLKTMLGAITETRADKVLVCGFDYAPKCCSLCGVHCGDIRIELH